MPFVLPLTDQEAENARLLDRLTKQQEINQSLRVENAQLKADLEQKDADWNDWLNGAFGDDLYPISPSPEPEDFVEKVLSLRGEIEELKHREYCLRQDAKGHSPSEVQEYRDEIEELNAENDKLKNDLRLCAEGLIPNDLIQRGIVETCREKVKQLELEIERLKAESIRSVEENRKTILEAKFSTWREEQAKYNPDYNMEEEAQWLIDETTHISDAIEIFNDLYEEGGYGDEYIWQLKCDHERKWEVYQVYMNDEGDYTLTEEEFEALRQEDNDPEEYGEYTWKQGLTAEEIARGDTINPETGEALNQ